MDSGVGNDYRSILEEPSTEKPIYLPRPVLVTLKKEFNITDTQITSFVISLIERTLSDHYAEVNGKIFSQSETEEIESDLKGLGYI
jgi:hypothetical protein